MVHVAVLRSRTGTSAEARVRESDIRASSMGNDAAPSVQNSHPFVFSSGKFSFSFMHNGHIARFLTKRKTKWSKSVPESIQAQVLGSTDSEWLGAFIFSSFLSSLSSKDEGSSSTLNSGVNNRDLGSILVDAVEGVLRTISDEDESEGSFSSINLVASLGESVLVATRFRSGIEDPPSLYAHAGAKVRQNDYHAMWTAPVLYPLD